MLVEMNKATVQSMAEQALERIRKSRQEEVEALIDAEIEGHHKWTRRLKKIGLGFLCGEMSRETALSSLKAQTFSSYTLAMISQGRRELHLKRIVKACKKAESDTVQMNEEDIRCL